MDERLRILEAALQILPESEEITRELLQPLAAGLPRKFTRKSISRSMRFAVYCRDNFTCRYCGRQTVLDQAVRYLSVHFPDVLPYHPHWKRTETHPLYPDITASCDHVVPVALGGDSEATNLVTACAKCQYMKRDWLLSELGWTLREASTHGWDGLAGAFMAAYKAKPLQDPELEVWAELIESQRPTPDAL